MFLLTMENVGVFDLYYGLITIISSTGVVWVEHNAPFRDATEKNMKKSILFLCTGNSCRSQMAEGWARKLKGDVFDVFSAGVKRHGLNPDAVAVMAEAGVDISGQRSKTVGDLPAVEFDSVVTLCGHAAETCPFFPGKTRRIHAGFDDPPSLAGNAVSRQEALGHYRRVRDEIRAFVEAMPENLR